ncbi:MAG: hypothetical protein ACRCXN_11620 [Bacteroidales bacterium]
MKKLALFATVALSTISCSNNEVMDSLADQNEIRFTGVQMGNSIITRTKEILTGKETFGVYAFVDGHTPAYISDEKLSITENGWRLSEKYYYPTGEFSMKFWAWGKNKNENIPTSVSTEGLVYTDYTINQSSTSVHEAFVISKDMTTVTNKTKENAIALNFWHALCKIQFTAKIANATNFANVDAKITGISINTSTKGSITYTGSESEWTPGAKTDETITITNKNALTDSPSSVTSSFYAIPLATDGTNTITVKADLYHKGTSIKVADQLTGTITATGKQLAINNSVTYNIILDLDNATGLTEIKFAEPTIEDWNPVNSDDTTIPANS